ncbi:hypothetical protein PL373_16750 [Tenacibaculum maritimum]|nr:hypothetical protein [Tenacibaculum maritimum]MDB0602745.1 hypothetical protein [Tenacibaculum maritimum]MDB0612347.1 hypothetical protein [Tenacibaculum maritimum]
MKKTAFNYIKGEPIDLDRQDHRDEIIKRNKKLESAIKKGISYRYFTIHVCVTAELNCLKCGDHVEETKDDIEIDDDIYDNIPELKCASCATRYVYDISERKFYPRLKIQKQKILKRKL